MKNENKIKFQIPRMLCTSSTHTFSDATVGGFISPMMNS